MNSAEEFHIRGEISDSFSFQNLLQFFVIAYYVYTELVMKGRMLRSFPNLPRYPFIGSIPYVPLNLKLAPFFDCYFEKLGRIFVFWMGHRPTVMISDADVTYRVLNNIKDTQMGHFSEQMVPLFGNGLFITSGDLWKSDKKLLDPFFNYQKFNGFLSCFNKHSQILVNSLKNRTKNGIISENLQYYLKRTTMDFIIEATLGQPSTFQTDLNNEIIETCQLVIDCVRIRLIRPWLTFPVIWDIFGLGKQEKHAIKQFSIYIQEFIDKRKQVLETEEAMGEETRPFIDAVLNKKTYEDTVSHIFTIFVTGFGTSASALQYTLFLLAQEQKCQAKVYQELETIFGNNTFTDITLNDLTKMKYLEMCIKEALRLYPVAPFIVRLTIKDILLSSGLVIPAGADLLICVRELHQDPRHFPDPEQFIPERFLPENCKKRHPYAYLPFGKGPRMCIGMKYAMMLLKVCLANVLINFKVSTNQTRKDIKVIHNLVLECSPPIQLTLKSRFE